jgi:isoleucyl-tRNA synthetase
MKWAAEKIQDMTDDEIDKVLISDFVLNPDFLKKNEPAITISAEDIDVTTNEIEGFEVAVKGILTVALDLVITSGLKNEGFAREFINRIQNIRKESNFELVDKILLNVEDKDGVRDILSDFNKYICEEILADKIEFSDAISNGTTIDVNNATLTVKVTKKGN